MNYATTFVKLGLHHFRLDSLRDFVEATLLSSHFSHPAWHMSSSTMRSRILKALEIGLSKAQASHPVCRRTAVTPNQPTADSAPAAQPAQTCRGVW